MFREPGRAGRDARPTWNVGLIAGAEIEQCFRRRRLFPLSRCTDCLTTHLTFSLLGAAGNVHCDSERHLRMQHNPHLG